MSSFSADKRTELIEVHRVNTVRDSYGDEIKTPALYLRAYASVHNGTGGERRQAAQEAGSQSATFGLSFSLAIAQIKLTDKIIYAGGDWDISSVVVEPRNAGVVIAAIRAQ